MDLEAIVLDHGWRVLGPAGSVDQALQLLNEFTPDVAVLDVNLWGQQVTPVAEALHSRGVPFVLASAYEADEIYEELLAQAPRSSKPAMAKRLFAALERAVRV